MTAVGPKQPGQNPAPIVPKNTVPETKEASSPKRTQSEVEANTADIFGRIIKK
jgi:hypothetical protein